MELIKVINIQIKDTYQTHNHIKQGLHVETYWPKFSKSGMVLVLCWHLRLPSVCRYVVELVNYRVNICSLEVLW